jgi:hypothetical protein
MPPAQHRQQHQQQQQYYGHGHHQAGQGQQPPIVLNVAEKPSVARSLAAVFGRLPGAQDKGMTRQVHQIFRHENVCFPSVYQQGHGQLIQGPGKKKQEGVRFLVVSLRTMHCKTETFSHACHSYFKVSQNKCYLVFFFFFVVYYHFRTHVHIHL